jgi:Uma2 family endonuclease
MATKMLMTAVEFSKSGSSTDGFELVRGEIIPMPPPGDRHGIVCANGVFLLKTYTRKLGRGTVMSNDSGIVTAKGPDSVRGVDIALFLNPIWQDQPAPEGYTDQAPDLAVEVRSPHQSWSDIVAKVAEYLRMSVRWVWVVDPQVRRVTLFAPDSAPQTLAAENEIGGGTILPGFKCLVADLFEGI